MPSLRLRRLRCLLAPVLALGLSACTLAEESDPSDVTATAGAGGARSEESTGSGGDRPSCVDYDDPDTYMATATLAGDVMPLFQARCNSDSCHGNGASSPKAGLRLGPAEGVTPTAQQLQTVHAAIVGVDALRAHMALVVPGEPAQSFLLLKTEPTHLGACEPVSCKSLGCGTNMPASGRPALSAGELKLLRTWIRDGALAD